MKYTAEEVREWAAFAQAQGKLYASMKGAHEPWEKLEAMLTAYAERIKADKVAAPVAMLRHFNYSGIARNGFSQEAQMLDGAPELPDGTELFTHPPAQAAQPEDWRIAFFERWHEAAQEKGYVGIAAAITAVPAAEPVAQPADSGRVPDGWVLVPREPTKAMQTAHHIYGDTSDWWSAVIAAVPSAPEGESHE